MAINGREGRIRKNTALIKQPNFISWAWALPSIVHLPPPPPPPSSHFPPPFALPLRSPDKILLHPSSPLPEKSLSLLLFPLYFPLRYLQCQLPLGLLREDGGEGVDLRVTGEDWVLAETTEVRTAVTTGLKGMGGEGSGCERRERERERDFTVPPQNTKF